MRYKQGIGNLIIGMVVECFFVYQGIRIFMQGQYFFAVVWTLLCAIPLMKTLYACIGFVRDGVRKRRNHQDEDFFHENEEVDAYQRRTQASNEKQRLQKVEELYQDGLLTKEEYEEKRKEIIDQI